MSPSDGAEGVARLRRAVAAIEGRREAAAPRASGRLPLTRALDRALGGGLAADGLHEIAPASPADGGAAMGFALALAARFMAVRRRAAIVMAEDFALAEWGAFYGPGLAAFGLDLARLVFVRAPDPPALFQAMEDALKSGAPAAVIGEVWRLKTYDLAASRRLLLAARAGGAPALLAVAGAYGAADALSSAAETRFEIAAAPSAHLASAGGGRGLPGAPAFAVRLVKARIGAGGAGQGADPTRTFRLTWRAEELSFDEPTLSLPVAAAADDRPRATRA
jgi:protein ImuA